jgi:MtN3 and saliva related transmembrane protein
MTLAMGVFAAVLTTSCWVPQLRRTLRRGTASDFAWPYLALLSLGLAGWFVYGILRADPVIVFSNALVLGSVLIVISVKLRSRRLTFNEVELAVPAGTDPVAALESLVNIGPQLAADLRRVGITDAPSLRTVGIEEANRRLVESGLQTGVHSRQAIQAAISEEKGTATTPKAGRKRHRGPFEPEGRAS